MAQGIIVQLRSIGSRWAIGGHACGNSSGHQSYLIQSNSSIFCQIWEATLIEKKICYFIILFLSAPTPTPHKPVVTDRVSNSNVTVSMPIFEKDAQVMTSKPFLNIRCVIKRGSELQNKN